MRTPTGGNAADLLLNPAQRATLTAAKAWWQEGERSLDYLAEFSRQETLLAQLRPVLDALRPEPHATPAHIAPILRIARQVTGNRAINRTLETEAFASALRSLLFAEAPLPERLTAFLANQRIGPQMTSHLLYTAFPDRMPLVKPVTRAVVAPKSPEDAREAARFHYQLTTDTPRETVNLLADFMLYEAVRQYLNLANFTAVNAVLWHAREMPRTEEEGKKKRRIKTDTVRETAEAYAAPPEPVTETTLVNYIEGYIAAQGFTFPSLTVRNYYISLKAKPFALLTGLSGTGKTRLTRLIADALTGNASGQYLLLPVRPDWTDSTPLLGYHNLLTDRYVSTSFVSLLTDAARPENRDRAYFVCLDEMNLARVEHYFAELLSAMETAERTVPLADGRTVTLPENVFLSGSVNLDEATHPFSRKVLDRANTLEFTEVTLHPLPETARPIVLPDIPPAERQHIFLSARTRTVADAITRLTDRNRSYPDRCLTVLSELNNLLTPRGLHFAYRVRDEVLRYVAASFVAEGTGLLADAPEENLQIALDFQILQKVLPRISGTEDALKTLLRDLEAWATTNRLPRTATKLARMRTRAAEDGIVSFYEL